MVETGKGDLLKKINPKMLPQEVVTRIKRFNELDFNQTHISIILQRNKLLTDSENNPEEWTFYTNHIHSGGKLSVGKELDNFFSKHFPSDIEYLAIQGSYIGGAYLGEIVSGVIKNIYNPNGYTVFVRVRPDMLSESSSCE